MQAAVTDVIDDDVGSGKVFKMAQSYYRMAFSGFRAFPEFFI